MIENLIPKRTYEVKTRCLNCKTIQQTKIRKGNKAEEVLQNGKCENCGCQTLELVR